MNASDDVESALDHDDYAHADDDDSALDHDDDVDIVLDAADNVFNPGRSPLCDPDHSGFAPSHRRDQQEACYGHQAVEIAFCFWQIKTQTRNRFEWKLNIQVENTHYPKTCPCHCGDQQEACNGHQAIDFVLFLFIIVIDVLFAFGN